MAVLRGGEGLKSEVPLHGIETGETPPHMYTRLCATCTCTDHTCIAHCRVGSEKNTLYKMVSGPAYIVQYGVLHMYAGPDAMSCGSRLQDLVIEMNHAGIPCS